MKARVQESKPKAQVKEGTHLARLVGIIDMGLRPEFVWQGKVIPPDYQYELTYELVNSLMDDGRPHHVTEMITNKITPNPKDDKMSNLTRRLQAMGGDSNNIESLLGKACMVTVKLRENGWPKIPGQTGVTAVPEGMPVKELVNKTFVFDLENPDLDFFLSLPEFKQERIKENLEYEGSTLQIALDRLA